MNYLDKELKQTDPEKIAYIAFSNVAVEEAKERITNDKVYVSTMHALWAHRELQYQYKDTIIKRR